MADFTPAQAKAWVIQEFPKHTTVESIRSRLASEETMIKWIVNEGRTNTNSYRAHKDLHGLLTKLLAEVTAGPTDAPTAAVTWKRVLPDEDTIDPEVQMLADGKWAGISIQDCRAYGGGWAVNKYGAECPESPFREDDYFMMDCGMYRTLMDAKAKAFAVFTGVDKH